MLPFSVVLIARNEAKTLPRLVASLMEFLSKDGELIVVDTGSTDNTGAVATNLGAHVYGERNRFDIVIDADTAKKVNRRFLHKGEAPLLTAGDRLFDYSAARNYAASLAKNDMIAMPDCDEYYTTLDLEMISRVIEDGFGRLEYDFVFSHDAEGRPLIEFKHSKFYNRKQLHWEGVIHETLYGTANQVYLPPELIKLEHGQNAHTDRSHYIRGLAYDCFKKPKGDRNCHYFGRELYFTGRFAAAIKELDRHIAMTNAWATERAQSAIYKGMCYAAQGQQDAAEQSFQQALRIDPARRSAWLHLAWMAFARENAQSVACYAQAALAVQRDSFYGNGRRDYEETPHTLLYWAYPRLGDKEAGRRHYDIAAGFAPEDEAILRDRVFFYPDEAAAAEQPAEEVLVIDVKI